MADAFQLLRIYEEAMLEAYLDEAEDFPGLLHYCNLSFEILPQELGILAKYPEMNKVAKRAGAIAIVAAGYGSDMSDELVDYLLGGLELYNDRPRCSLLKHLRPQLDMLVEQEVQNLNRHR